MLATVPQQRIDQRSLVVAGAGMHHHVLGLVDHQQMLVLIDDVQRNLLRLRLCLRVKDRIPIRFLLTLHCLRQQNAQLRSGLQAVVLSGRCAVQLHHPLCQPLLCLTAAELGQGLLQKFIDALTRLLRQHSQLQAVTHAV